jgi:hypothetical protein
MKIRPIRTQEELTAVHAVAKDDNHLLAWPSHIMEKDDHIVGSLSVMPMVMIWMHTEKTNGRDLLFLKDHLEATIANSGRVFCVPCVDGSPLMGALNKESLGYINIGKTNLFLKGV